VILLHAFSDRPPTPGSLEAEKPAPFARRTEFADDERQKQFEKKAQQKEKK
jgi:hypothetical protein